MDLTLCPACGALAEVQWRDVVTSTDAPVELAKVVCAARHWFLLPVAALERPPARSREREDMGASTQHPARRRSAVF